MNKTKIATYLVVPFIAASLIYYGLQPSPLRLQTVYGDIEIHEPVLVDLIASAPMQRLKKIHQYGVGHLINDKEWYSRYDHSVGVFALLRTHGLSLEEQIAGLLHDVSHTAFSHLADYYFEHGDKEESYQDTIHGWYLKKSGIAQILAKHGYTVEKIEHKNGNFIALERDLPHLCADRIDYNLQGAFLRGWLSKAEMDALYNDLQFDGQNWNFSNTALAEKLANFSVDMTFQCWGAPDQYMANLWLGDAIKKAIANKEIEKDALFFGTDGELWAALAKSSDPYIKAKLVEIENSASATILARGVNPGDSIIKNPEFTPGAIPIKLRAINPLIRTKDGLKPLTDLSETYDKRFKEGKSHAQAGWRLSSSLAFRQRSINSSKETSLNES